ncbi:MAG: hypothetical protein F4Y00_11450 [Bacteroidetes bacterium SB0662_bin_6]|nr:hypothetical protein [Bacteroidetes bacterium SB0662_bin_6]
MLAVLRLAIAVVAGWWPWAILFAATGGRGSVRRSGGRGTVSDAEWFEAEAMIERDAEMIRARWREEQGEA